MNLATPRIPDKTPTVLAGTETHVSVEIEFEFEVIHRVAPIVIQHYRFQKSVANTCLEGILFHMFPAAKDFYSPDGKELSKLIILS